MSNVSIYKFDNTTEIRVVEIKGNPWFLAVDVLAALGMDTRQSQNYQRHLDSSEKQVICITQGKGNPNKTVITESGLYKLVLRLDKPEARRFQDWVTRDVLPAIRKDGAYIMSEEKVATGEMDEDAFVLKAIETLQRKIDRLSSENKQLTTERDGLSSVVGQHFQASSGLSAAWLSSRTSRAATASMI